MSERLQRKNITKNRKSFIHQHHAAFDLAQPADGQRG